MKGLRHKRGSRCAALLAVGEEKGVGHEPAFHRSLIGKRFKTAQNIRQPLGDIVLGLPTAVDADAGHQSGAHAARHALHEVARLLL